MKLDKEIFEKLNAERQKHIHKVFAIDRAYNALQELCEHKWVEEEIHGYTGHVYCVVCGKDYEKTEK